MRNQSASNPRFALLFATLTLALPLLLMACTDLNAPTEMDPAPEEFLQAKVVSDSLLMRSVASVDIRKSDNQNKLRIRFKPGTPEKDKERIRRHFEQSERYDQVIIGDEALVASGGTVEKHRGRTKENKGEAKIPAPTLDDKLTSAIQSIEVRKEKDGADELRITLKPGMPEGRREEIREQLQQGHRDLKVVISAPAATPVPFDQEEEAHGPRVSDLPVRPVPAVPDTTEFSEVDEKPEIIGGSQALYDAIEYPETARTDSVEGTVHIEFVVTESGEVDRIEVLQSPSDVLSQEAKRAVKTLRFHPGEKDGKPVPVHMTLPIRFNL